MARIVRRSDWITTPWRNGGGVTHELWREAGPADPAVFHCRLSIAEVAADGPFSSFPGIDRIILMLDGDGFRLRRADGLTVDFAHRAVPFAFHGEDPWSAELFGGPVHDFNVMVDRAHLRAAVSVVPAEAGFDPWLFCWGLRPRASDAGSFPGIERAHVGGRAEHPRTNEEAAAAAGGPAFVLALDDGIRVGDERLARWELAVLDGPTELAGPAGSSAVLVTCAPVPATRAGP